MIVIYPGSHRLTLARTPQTPRPWRHPVVQSTPADCPWMRYLGLTGVEKRATYSYGNMVITIW